MFSPNLLDARRLRSATRGGPSPSALADGPLGDSPTAVGDSPPFSHYSLLIIIIVIDKIYNITKHID